MDAGFYRVVIPGAQPDLRVTFWAEGGVSVEERRCVNGRLQWIVPVGEVDYLTLANELEQLQKRIGSLLRNVEAETGA